MVIQKTGHVRRHRDEWLEFQIKISCEPHVQSLSSGVVNRELQCQVSESTDPWKELKVSYALCFVQPFGPRSRHVKVQYGSYALKGASKGASKGKDGTRLQRVTRESVAVDGDVICGNDKLGMGRETQVSLYTNEQPSVIDPSVGSRKQIFSLKTITTKAGSLVMRMRDEVVASTLPATFSPRVIHPRLAAIGKGGKSNIHSKSGKSEFFKTNKTARAAKAKRVAKK